MPRAHRGLALCAALGAWLLAMFGLGNAGEAAGPTEAGWKCAIPAEEQWSAAEKFAWDRICAGRQADFSENGVYLDPAKAEGWEQDRTLSAAFLRTILSDRYRQALTPVGVSIVNARFTEAVELQNAELTRELSVRSSRFDKGADLTRLRSTRSLRLDYSVAQAPMVMDSLQLAGDLSAYGGDFASVSLRSANIDGWARFSGAKLRGKLDMNGIRIHSDLYLRTEEKDLRAEFAEIELAYARVGQVNLQGAKVTGQLNMDGAAVSRHVMLIIDRANGIKPEFADVMLDVAQIGGGLFVTDGEVKGELKCRMTEVNQIAMIGFGTTFRGTVRCQWARFKGDLSFAGGIFHDDLLLDGTQIGGELTLGYAGYKPATWVSDGKDPNTGPTLVLHNAVATTIPNPSDAWPRDINVAGLTYKGLRNIHTAQDEPFEPWFARQSEYSRQPYEQLAQIFQTAGMSEKATEIRYAGRDRERRDAATGGWHWAALTFLKWTIGYGYYPMLAAAWAIGLIFLGAAILRVSGQGPANRMPFGLTYSFDTLLPVITLRDGDDRVILTGWVRYYFYGHKIFGYVLASVLIAGLAGLTK